MWGCAISPNSPRCSCVFAATFPTASGALSLHMPKRRILNTNGRQFPSNLAILAGLAHSLLWGGVAMFPYFPRFSSGPAGFILKARAPIRRLNAPSVRTLVGSKDFRYTGPFHTAPRGADIITDLTGPYPRLSPENGPSGARMDFTRSPRCRGKCDHGAGDAVQNPNRS